MDALKREITLSLPAEQEFVLLARMALCGLGMLAGLDVGLIDDLRSATDEVCDCLMHQKRMAARIELRAWLTDSRLHCEFQTLYANEQYDGECSDHEVSRCVLETLMPDVALINDECGVGKISFSLPL
ncbi:MAG TPA: hypothetical protein PKU80_09450 [Candidatus Limiplasma sp.]|nr:hypothetical protein [Candidatus Limiplasma sp.]HRX09799.1 hypothetical protein [Candidatus Limiplasma sp.]